MGLDWKVRAATLDNVEENDIENCMEIIRKTTETKSFDEIVKLLHVVSSEQKARKMLRTCMDKVLMNMAGSSNLRDVIDRLRSVARINGLRFNVVLDQETSGPGTTCQILADMFTMEITLDGESQFCGPSVLDVKILYSDHVKKCPKIVEVIRDGNFLELSKQLKGLTEIYPSSMDRTTRTRMYMALQSLDMDLLKMSQVYRESHKDCELLEIVLSGYVGLLTPRDAGTSSQLKYFLSPYDLMDMKTKQIKSTQNIPEKIGMVAEIGIEVNDGQCRLPITPLIANNHPTDETSKPRFSEINQHNSVLLPACYTLKLHPPVPV
uniref:Mediator of RNA polymerase II transcription subunit 1 n=1 Tax=Ciona savignyi TaxID=51511 RepID=H2ZMZ5_CIOSA